MTLTQQITPAIFSTTVVFTKREAFACCEAMATAERVLVRSGHHHEAALIAAAFELLEARLIGST